MGIKWCVDGTPYIFFSLNPSINPTSDRFRQLFIVMAEEVIKPADNSSLEKRLEDLERKLEQLKDVIFRYSDKTLSITGKQCGRRDSNPGNGLGREITIFLGQTWKGVENLGYSAERDEICGRSGNKIS